MEVGGAVVLFVLHRNVTPLAFMKRDSDILAVFVPATPDNLIVPFRTGGVGLSLCRNRPSAGRPTHTSPTRPIRMLPGGPGLDA